MIAWWSAFLVTQLAEMPVYAWSQRPSRGWRDALGFAFVPSAITHPILWATWSWWPHDMGDGTKILVAEAVVVAVEGVLWSRLQRRSLPWGLRVALVANLWSVIVGEGLRALVGWP